MSIFAFICPYQLLTLKIKWHYINFFPFLVPVTHMYMKKCVFALINQSSTMFESQRKKDKIITYSTFSNLAFISPKSFFKKAITFKEGTMFSLNIRYQCNINAIFCMFFLNKRLCQMFDGWCPCSDW